jgi:hypothetical protein
MSESKSSWHFNQNRYNEQFKDILNIKFEVYKLTHQSVDPMTSNSIQATSQGVSFTFEAPSNFAVNLIHEYAEYDSIATRAAGFWANASVFASDLAGTAAGVSNFIKSSILAEGKSANELSKARTANIIGSHNVLYNRVDAPLVYRFTQRLQYLLSFDIAWFSNSYGEVFAGVQEFMRYTCPETKSNFTSIDAPYVFKVTSSSPYDTSGTNPLLKVDYAAVEQVTATWREPYVGGYPTNATVLIQIKDIQPTYDWQFSGNSSGVIKVSSKGGNEGSYQSKPNMGGFGDIQGYTPSYPDVKPSETDMSVKKDKIKVM